MNAIKFKITTADGVEHVGYVQGSGGIISGADGLRRLEMARNLVSKGRKSYLYEPRPGCVLVMREEHGAFNDPANEHVPLLGATIAVVKDGE